MTCHEARDRLSAFVDDALAPPERVALEGHVATCADCRRELGRLRETVSLLRAMEPVRAPLGFVDRVLAATRPDPWPRRLVRRLFLPLRIKLPLEVAAVALVAVAAVYVYERTPDVREAAQKELAPPPVAPVSPVAPPAPTAGTPQSSAEGSSPKLADQPKEERTAATKPTRRAVAGAPRRQAPAAREADKTDTLRPEEAFAKAPEPTPPAETRAATEQSAAESGRGTSATGGTAGAVQEKAKTAPARRVDRLSAGARVTVDVSGRLVVRDRQVARAALAELIARLGGSQLARRPDPGVPSGEVVELLLPRAAYPEFADGLRQLGQWLPDGELPELAELPAEVRAVVHLTD